MNKELRKIKNQLQDIAKAESMKLFRMARRLEKHGGSPETVNRIREEAFTLHNTGYPEKVIRRIYKMGICL